MAENEDRCVMYGWSGKEGEGGGEIDLRAKMRMVRGRVGQDCTTGEWRAVSPTPKPTVVSLPSRLMVVFPC